MIPRLIRRQGTLRSLRGRSRLSPLWLCGGLLLQGCHHVGPGTLVRDRFDYSESVAQSWKEQTLLNLVKLRYMDLPVFLDVGQIVSGYTLETSADVSGSIVWPRAADSVGLGGSWRFTDRPTITYTPLTGEAFLRSLIAPIPPMSVFYLLQSGYPADFVLGLAVSNLNGLRNPLTTSAVPRDRVQDFGRALELLRDLQVYGAFGMRVEVGAAKEESVIVFFRADNLPEAITAKIDEVRSLLGIPKDRSRLRLVYSPVRAGPDDLTVQTRSVLQSLLALSGAVEVPHAHVEEGRAVPLPDPDPETKRTLAFSIHSGTEKPKDAFVAVPYRSLWYWINDTDWRSKRVFAFILFLFTLSDSKSSERLPLITIPAG